MLGWGILVTYVGLVACRLALRPHRPVAWYTRSVLGGLALTVIMGVMMGPLDNNRTPEHVRAVAALPVLAAEPEAQHTFRIYLTWNLTRTSPLFVPLSALAVGAGLAVLQGVVGGRSFLFLAVALMVTLLAFDRGTARYFDLAADPRNWLPLPVFPAALVLAVFRTLGLRESWAWAAAGAVFGAGVVAIWGAPPGLMLLAVPAMVLGARLGSGIAATLLAPTRAAVARLVGVAGFMVPAGLGLVDLYLRTHTP